MGQKKVRERLDRSAADLALVRITRDLPDADRIEGFVVAVDRDWVLLARVSDQIDLDGWIALRVGDIASVRRTPTSEDCFVVKVLKARAQWPPTAPDPVALDSLDDVLATAASHDPLVALHQEADRPDTCWIGAVRASGPSEVRLLQIDTEAGWARTERAFDPDDVTRVDFGGRYESALALVGGPPPAET